MWAVAFLISNHHASSPIAVTTPGSLDRQGLATMRDWLAHSSYDLPGKGAVSNITGIVPALQYGMQIVVLRARLLLVPRYYLYSGITVLSVLGMYAISAAILDLWILLGVSLLGFVMRRY